MSNTCLDVIPQYRYSYFALICGANNRRRISTTKKIQKLFCDYDPRTKEHKAFFFFVVTLLEHHKTVRYLYHIIHLYC